MLILIFDYYQSFYSIYEKESVQELWSGSFNNIEEYSVKEIYNGILKVYELLMGDKHESER